MSKKIKKFSEYPTYDKNPFIPYKGNTGLSFTHKYKPVITDGTSGTYVTAVNGDGEVVGTMVWVRHDKVDEETFIKLYVKHFQALFDLSTAGVRAFLYFLKNLKPNKDIVFFNLEECMSYTGYSSKATVYKGLAELLEANIIARGKYDYLYYVNYHFAFNGNRAKFSYEIQKKEKQCKD